MSGWLWAGLGVVVLLLSCLLVYAPKSRNVPRRASWCFLAFDKAKCCYQKAKMDISTSGIAIGNGACFGPPHPPMDDYCNSDDGEAKLTIDCKTHLAKVAEEYRKCLKQYAPGASYERICPPQGI